MEQIFQCGFCTARGTKTQVTKHEFNCYKNPKNNGCGSCNKHYWKMKFLRGDEICCTLELMPPDPPCKYWQHVHD